LKATIARFRASSPGTPAGQFAVNRAGKGVAGLVFLGGGAAGTTKSVGGDDGTRTLLGTSVAGCRARREGGPGRDLAVNGAGESVASSGRLGGRASKAAEYSRVHDRARLGLGTSATSLGAHAVTRPAGYLAVDGTGKGVASLVLPGVGAAHTAMNVGADNGTRALLCAGGASDGARGVGGPGSYLAVNGASEGVASFDSLGTGACSTARSSSHDHRTSARLGARGASGRAGTEGGPTGDLTVDRTGLSVAELRTVGCATA